jgi:putative ABC transport system permease protein
MPLVAGNKNRMTTVAGVNADYLLAREWQVASGRFFADDELATGAKVAIAGSVIIEELFEGRAGVGERFRIGNVPFTVIERAEQKGTRRIRSKPR